MNSPVVSKDNEAESVVWNTTRFGVTTSEENNKIQIDKENKTVILSAGNKEGTATGGKVTGSNDGMSYYYTAIDKSKNFEISADVTVNYFEKAKPDKQCGFGIMVRDTLGVENDISVAPSNMCLVGGYKGMVQSVFRNGVTSDLSSKIVMENVHKFGDRPVNDGTAKYKLKLKKTNTGYIASVDDGEEVTYYRPKQLEVVDKDNVYVGFFVARVAGITVSNIELHTSDVATDPVGEKEPEAKVKPSIKVNSAKNTGSSKYDLDLNSTVNGKVTVKQGDKELYSGDINANTSLKVPTTLEKGNNKFDVTYTTTEGEPIEVSHNVTYKSYGVADGDVFVSQTGTENGDGTVESPIDIQTALTYTNDGQTIKVKGGVYNLTSPLKIDSTNSGTSEKMKTLTSYDGERPVFDFGKNCDGFTIAGNYWHVYGIDVCNTADTKHGISLSGSYNTIEAVKTYRNGDTGLQISTDTNADRSVWPSYNLILKCDSYDNMDVAMNNADGFAAKITCGEGNVFR